MSRDSIRAAVHNGDYHTDDIFAMAIANMWAMHRGYDIVMTRTRDESILKDCQIVMDIGGVYDPEHHRFDHHQSSFQTKRENGIPYASAGLVWKHYGIELCDGNQLVWEYIDSHIIQQIDAPDNGIFLTKSNHPSGVFDLTLGGMVSLLKPTWRELQENPEIIADRFWEMVSYAKVFLGRVIVSSRDTLEGVQKVKNAYAQAADKRIIELDGDYSWEGILSDYSEPLYVLYRRKEGNYGVKCVRANGYQSFETRVSFPISWRGLSGDELVRVSGYPDAVFCHRDGFLCVVKTRESALSIIADLLVAQ